MGGLVTPVARKSLADLRATKPESRAERSVSLCLAPNLVAEVQALSEELANLPAPVTSVEGDEPTGPPRRLVAPAEAPRAAEIRQRLAELLAEMAEHEGELRVRATTDGEWRRWTNEHPGRDEDEPGHKRDQDVSYGFCNADDLIDNLSTYAYSWNGERLEDGDWAILAKMIAPPDLKQIATSVVAMHESAVPLGKWRAGLSASLSTYSASASPAPSASAPDDFTAGSPSGDPSTSTNSTPTVDADAS